MKLGTGLMRLGTGLTKLRTNLLSLGTGLIRLRWLSIIIETYFEGLGSGLM